MNNYFTILGKMLTYAFFKISSTLFIRSQNLPDKKWIFDEAELRHFTPLSS